MRTKDKLPDAMDVVVQQKVEAGKSLVIEP